MTWEPITESELASLIEKAESRMGPPMLALWGHIRVSPVKWELAPWGIEGGGFWVVAVIGQTCVWYNDIEDGFNISRYESYGRISDYWCNQDELDHCLGSSLQSLLRDLGCDVRRINED